MSRERQSHEPPAFTPARSIVAHQAERYKRRGDGAVPVANPTEIARFIRKDSEQLRRTMQLEMVVAQYYLRLRNAETAEGVSIADATLFGFVADLEAYRDGLSLAILRTYADLAPDASGRRAHDAARVLESGGLMYPARFRAVGTARALEAWAVGDERETCVFVEVVHDDGNRHGFGAFIDHDLDGVAKHLGLTPSIWETPHDSPFHPTRMDNIDVREAGHLLLSGVTTIDPRSGIAPIDSEDFRPLIAAARARHMIAGAAEEAA